MAQPQQQYSMPPRSYSPPGNAASPGAQQQFGMPPNKRQRLSPNPTSQPGSPYIQSPYAMSPGVSAPAAASPHFATVGIPQGVYNTPYSTTNGHTTPGLNLPQSQTNLQTNHQSNHQNHFQSSVNFANPLHTSARPDFGNYGQGMPPSQPYQGQMPHQNQGAMGPPSKPVEKPKEDGVDVMDVLGGTGIDLREEEGLQYTFQLSNNSFNSQLSGSQSGNISSSHSFSQFPPGDPASLYGAGPANAAAEKVDGKSQDEYTKKLADQVWNAAAANLAASRQRELRNPFLIVQVIQAKMGKVARENGLSLNVDKGGQMGTMKLPENFTQRGVQIQAQAGPENTFLATNGTFLPIDTMLVDQVALMSIATKHRLRGLVEDALKLAKGRQTGSHGIVPEEWIEAAAPITVDSNVTDGGPRSGWESAVSPHSNPLNRSTSIATKLPTPVSDGGKTPTAPTKITNEVVGALRTSALKERDLEEARLRKRLARAAGEVPSRQGSIISGTPGSVAPDSMEKAPTKKEQKKNAAAKVNEAANHAAANTTTAQFLFGKKQKKYSWLTGGGASGGGGSGASTPGRINTQGLGTPGSGPVNAPPEKLTAEGARRLGKWREDKERGVGIQIRDWITVLESDGREKKALQKVYVNLDHSDPK
ncbi:related to tpa inducible protein [Rhynchosporium secalis]|uniref:Transcription initiation factor TFIID subunit 4 n=1 Tax=Rhynchosporium secalis TaxID=38038 RepID=A0A1E1LV34_RHYSE|nr:related to tpa inducible protein [Rhynchosporium secalis]